MYPNPRKTTTMRHLGTIDISPLREAILAIPESVWDAENAAKPNRYEALDRTRHIVFRFIDSPLDWRKSHDRPVWEEWRDRLLPVMERATRAYGYARGGYPRVMFARMAAGGIIHPHIDENPAAQWPHKIHIPILTNPRVGFLTGGDVYHFPEGEAVEVNNLGLHAVRNDGDSDRIHLIFEYYDADQPDPEWVGQRS